MQQGFDVQVDGKRFFLAFLFFIAVLFALGYRYYESEEKLIDKNINIALERSVKSAQIIIGDSYHTAISITPPSAIEDADMIQKLTTLANAQGVVHIYSMILGPDGNLHFTSCSARDRKYANRNALTHFYDTYPKNDLMIKALKSNTTVVDMDPNLDQWRKFRSIYVPHTTASGYRYLIGADIDVDSIRQLSNASVFVSIASSIVILIGLFPFLLLYRRAMRRSHIILEKEVEWATDELRMINERLEEKVEEKTHELVQSFYYDTLTSLPNRLKFLEDIVLFPSNTVAIFNIDDFKEINDFFGIDAGDNLLTQVAYWLSEMKLNPYRIGGDEFVTILPRELSKEDIEKKITLLLSSFIGKTFIIEGESLHLRATIGIAIMSDKPLIHANIALNKARSLKKAYSMYDSSEGIEEQYKINIAMSAQIRQALIERRIICQYQPIINCKTGITEKYETLVRIQNPDGTLIAPNDFLLIAQKVKLYSTITQQVIYQACETFRTRNESFSVNLSSSDILDSNTVATIERILKQTGTANRIVFEILESEGIENFDEVASFIARMKELGASIAIDDFGSGYSNYENILKLNVDFLKIDGSLIKTIDQNPRHRIVVESIVDFAHRMGIETIAEFVATEDIYKIVAELGITYSQGYHTGKPISL